LNLLIIRKSSTDKKCKEKIINYSIELPSQTKTIKIRDEICQALCQRMGGAVDHWENGLVSGGKGQDNPV
jgi:hypothetical protein